MLDMQVELLQAIGINVGKMTPGEVYEIAGRAINDKELSILAGPGSGSRARAVRAMSPADRLRLRERVTGVVPFRRPQ